MGLIEAFTIVTNADPAVKADWLPAGIPVVRKNAFGLMSRMYPFG